MEKNQKFTEIKEKNDQKLKAGVERRLAFIDFRLYWEGRINRSEICEHFGVSIPQASTDLSLFQKESPDSIEYDRNEKTYKAKTSYNPRFIRPNSETYLNELHSIHMNLVSEDNSFIKNVPAFDFVPRPSRSIEPVTLFKIANAINDKRSLQITYQSMTSDNPSRREIYPHALANDGSRWHVRAFCGLRNSFRDFVFAHILEIEDGVLHETSPSDDHQWNAFVNVKLAPRNDLSTSQRATLELEYDMINGCAEVRVRHALLHYFLLTQRLSYIKNENKIENSNFYLILKNEPEIIGVCQELYR